MKGFNPVTIVVPVYGDWPSLKDCLESLIENVDLSSNKVVIANDCGPEADSIESSILSLIGDHANFEYYRNKKNLGFLKNCNNAVMKLDKTSNDILLLNSDTKTTRGFLKEMQAVLYDTDKKIAAVSPRSNNATICTIPLRAAPKKGIGQYRSFRLHQKIKKLLPSYSIVPTAHGFCMLVKRDVIKKHGLFDEVFGKGYGEEVDFCQRIRKEGLECALANHAFVFHQEAKSFGQEAKKKLIAESNQIVWERWPNYRQEVREYMNEAVLQETKLEKSLSAYKFRIKSAFKNRH